MIIQKLRYGIQGDKSLPEIIMLEDTLYIKDISKLENYFYMGCSLDKAIYNLLKKDLSKEYFEFSDFAQAEGRARNIGQNRWNNKLLILKNSL